MQQWKKDVDQFLKLADSRGVRMLMVGGAAVNFHGCQRHSAAIDFWLETSKENMKTWEGFSKKWAMILMDSLMKYENRNKISP